MNETVVLDSGPIGVLVNPNTKPLQLACRSWLDSIRENGRRIIIPEIADFEVRRELIRTKSHAAIDNLDALESLTDYLAFTTPAIRLAAKLWAEARNRGRPTAANHALDGDVILAAQAICLNEPVIVATDNVAHLGLFVAARNWTDIVP